MSQRKPIADALQDPTVSDKRKQQLKQAQQILQFGHETLKLPKNNSYTSYVDLKRKAISWNVIATLKYSISPIKTCFPFVGCVSYLVYFSKQRALLEAKKHKNLGHDTYIIASPAYSTLGIFDDPIVSTMFYGDMTSTANTMFHELAHQRVYHKNDSAFNEAFASTVGEQGTLLWLKQKHPKKLATYKKSLKKKWQFFNLLISTNRTLKTLYQTKLTKIEMKLAKKEAFNKLQQQYSTLKKSWGGDKRYDYYFEQSSLNNAKLAVIGVYYQQVPAFVKKLKELNYDYEKFYQHYSLSKH